VRQRRNFIRGEGLPSSNPRVREHINRDRDRDRNRDRDRARARARDRDRHKDRARDSDRERDRDTHLFFAVETLRLLIFEREHLIAITHCNALQRTATRCNALQHTDTYLFFAVETFLLLIFEREDLIATTHCNALQHTAAHRHIPFLRGGDLPSSHLRARGSYCEPLP